MLFFERFNIFKEDIGLVVELVALRLEVEDILVVLVPEVFVFLCLFDKFPRLIVQCIPLAGKLAGCCIQLVAPVFMFFRLHKNFLPLFHQVIQHALPLLTRFSFAGQRDSNILK